jgi:hypothetical protein
VRIRIDTTVDVEHGYRNAAFMLIHLDFHGSSSDTLRTCLPDYSTGAAGKIQACFPA